MEKKEKKLDSFFVKLFYLLLLIFIVLYISKSSGYYEFATHKQVELNEEEIAKFENDIDSGKNISVKDYIKEKDVNYSNFASNIGYEMSDKIEYVVTNGLDGAFNFFGQLISG